MVFLTTNINEEIKLIGLQPTLDRCERVGKGLGVFQQARAVFEDRIFQIDTDDSEIEQLQDIGVDIFRAGAIAHLQVHGKRKVCRGDDPFDDEEIGVEGHLLAVFVAQAFGDRRTRSG